MNKTQIIAIVAVAAIAIGGVTAAIILMNGGNNNGYDIKDAADVDVVSAGDVKSITAASPTAADLFCYLGYADKLKCVSTSNTNPLIPKDVTTCGSYSKPDTDAISTANSDVTILDASGRNAKAAYTTLKESGMKNIYLIFGSDDGVESIYTNIKIIGKIMGDEKKANETVDEMKEKVSNLSKNVTNGTSKNILVLTGWGSIKVNANGEFTGLTDENLTNSVYAAGAETTFLGLLKDTCKASTPFAGSSWKALDSDFISTKTDKVDMIIVLWTGAGPKDDQIPLLVDAAKSNAAWSNCKAVQDGNIFFMTELTGSNLQRMTPYTIDDLRVVSVYLHTECYSKTSGGAAMTLADLPDVLRATNKDTVIGYSENVVA